MTELFARLRQRKIVQWALAYAAAAFALLQGVDIVAQQFGWPDGLQRGITLAMVLGFFVVLVLAWYHGERGEQKVSGTELLILALVLAVGGGLLWKFAPTPAAAPVAAGPAPAAVPTPAPAHDNSIAVLPFVDMSQAGDQGYFSDGLSEELLNLLAQVPELRVIARTSSFSFKGKDVDAATIARTLGVEHLLEGSVRKSGNTLRITAQLIRASDSSHLWSKTYDRELTDVFKVQDEIANAVVEALKLKLLPNQQLSNPYQSANTEAYNEYLRGKSLLSRQKAENLALARQAFERALALDPTYAAPQAALADVEYVLADFAGDLASKQRALAVAERAIALGPKLADAHAARGVTRLSFFRDWDGARADFDRALQLNAASGAAQLGKYRLLMAFGRIDEAVATGRKAVLVDPLSTLAWISLGRALYAQGNLDEARTALERAMELSPDSPYGAYALGVNHLFRGEPESALTVFRRSDSVYRPTGIAMAEHSLGHARESRQALEQAIRENGADGAYQIAQAYAWRGEDDKTFEWLQLAIDRNDGGLTFLKSDPIIGRMASDPRYAAVVRKMGLPQ
jgi:serine/threonine-protein kinase